MNKYIIPLKEISSIISKKWSKHPIGERNMKKIIPIFLIMCFLISMTACSKDEIVEQYNQALQAVGDNCLTKNSDLQGKRSPGTDSYAGTYEAEYEGFSGKEILLEERRLNVTTEMK